MKLSNYQQMPTVAALMKPFPYFARPDEPVAKLECHDEGAQDSTRTD